MNPYGYIGENIEAVRSRIDAAAGRAGVHREDITLVAVTKTVEASAVQAASDRGLVHFGENRVQEYLQKKDAVSGKIFWHIIGQLQTNKVKYIVDGITLVHSLDRMALAQEIEKQCARRGRTMDALIEVNIAGEASKTGVAPDALGAFADELAPLEHLRVKGLMTVAPYTQDKASLRRCFAKMQDLFTRLRNRGGNMEMKWLSMGMSGDYEEAIAEGSNMVRIGTAIFGARPNK